MHYATYKTILGANNTFNVYRGCTHGCIYCDTRSDCYQFKHEFTDVEVKKDADIILDRQLSTKKVKSMLMSGAMCDPYIPLEQEICLTQKCLKVISTRGFGLSILTKSNLILRDAKLLQAINNNLKCVVQMTLTTYDEKLCRKLEPNVCTTLERVQVLKEFNKLGIPTVVWLGPILPYINDSEYNLRGLLDYCIEARVFAIYCYGFSVSLRAGNQEYFYHMLDNYSDRYKKEFYNIKAKYLNSSNNTGWYNSPNSIKLRGIFEEVCSKHNILHNPKQVWQYLHSLPNKPQQISLFQSTDK